MKTKSGVHWKACLMVLGGAASYGILSSFVKLAYAAGFGPAEVTGSQVLLGSVALWLISIPWWKTLKGISARERLKLLGSGVFTGLTGVFYYYSLTALNASFAVLLLFQFTWMGLLLEWLLHGKVPGRYQVAGVGVILLGTLLASGINQAALGQLSVFGVGLGLLAAACYTLFIYFSGRVAVRVPALLRSAWRITGAAVAVLIIYPPRFLWNGALTEGLWLWGAVLGLFGMIIPSFLYAKGAPHIETGLAAILGAIELPVVMLCSVLLLGEASGGMQWFGVGLILAGILLSELKRGTEAETVTTPRQG